MNSGGDLRVGHSFRPYLPGFFVSVFSSEDIMQNINYRVNLKACIEYNLRGFRSEISLYNFEYAIEIGRISVQNFRNENKIIFVQCFPVSSEVKQRVEDFFTSETLDRGFV